MDIEDAFKLKIFNFRQVKDMFFPFFSFEKRERIESIMDDILDENEKIAYLRSCVIGRLVSLVSEVFIENEQDILMGKFNGSLISHLPKDIYDAYKYYIVKPDGSSVYKSDPYAFHAQTRPETASSFQNY